MKNDDCAKAGAIELTLSLVCAGAASWLLVFEATRLSGKCVALLLIPLALIWEPKYFTDFAPGSPSNRKTKIIGWIIMGIFLTVISVHALREP